MTTYEICQFSFSLYPLSLHDYNTFVLIFDVIQQKEVGGSEYLQPVEVIKTADPDANVETLLLNSEYFKGESSLAEDFLESDKSRTMKKENPKTLTLNVKVTSTKFIRIPFFWLFQVLALSFLIMCQAVKVSDVSSLASTTSTACGSHLRCIF